MRLFAPDSYPKGGPGVVGVNSIGQASTDYTYTILLGDEPLETVSGQIDVGDSYEQRYSVKFGQADSVELRIEGDPSVVQQSSQTITLVEPRHEWNQYGGASSNTFRNLRSWGPHHEATERWTLKERMYGQPVSYDGELFVCSTHEGSSLVCLSLDVGDRVWETETNDVFEGATVSDGIVYFTEINSGGRTRAVTTDGNDVWEFEHDTYSNNQRLQSALPYHVPVVSGETVFVHSPEDGVFALNKRDGSVVWNTNDVKSICSLAADGGKLYGAGPLTGDLSRSSGTEQWIWSIQQDSGEVAWTVRTNVTADPDRYVGPEGETYEPEVRFTPPMVVDGHVHIGTSHRIKARGREGGPIDDGSNNHLFRIDKDSGDVGYEREVSDYGFPPAPATFRAGVSAPLTRIFPGFDSVLCRPSNTSDEWYWVSKEGAKAQFMSDILGYSDLTIPTNVAPVCVANGIYFLSIDNNLIQIDYSLEPHKVIEDVGVGRLESNRGLFVVDSKIIVSGSGGIRVYEQGSGAS